jgi:hypothetical protein
MSKITNIFENTSEGEEQEDYDVFERALKKKQFEGKKGHLLMELQTSYKNDQRFLLDKKFKDDVDTRKVSGTVKQMTHAFDKDKRANFYSHIKVSNKIEVKDQEIVDEKNKNMSILSQVISNSEFLGTVQPKKYSNPKNFLIKRFDPRLNMGKDLVIKEDKSVLAKENSHNTIKLQKGMKSLNEDNMLPADMISTLKKKEKEKNIEKAMNDLHNQLEPKVEIKFDSWKSIVNKQEEKSNMVFTLFDGYVQKDENSIENSVKELKEKKSKEKGLVPQLHENKTKPSFSLFEDNPKPNKSDSSKLPLDNKTSEEREKEEKLLLKKKRKLEKKKLKEKQKRDEQKLHIIQKDQQVEQIMKTEMLKEFDEEKVDNYMRYINLVREKTKNKKAKVNQSQ